jgi:hypothetical protein
VTVADILGARCAVSELPERTCAHCRPEVQAALADDPVFAQWLGVAGHDTFESE